MDAREGGDLMRVNKGLERLIEHCELINRMTAGPERDQAEKRLEQELGPELTRRLLARLSSAAA
jgi:hypothetical protein